MLKTKAPGYDNLKSNKKLDKLSASIYKYFCFVWQERRLIGNNIKKVIDVDLVSDIRRKYLERYFFQLASNL